MLNRHSQWRRNEFESGGGTGPAQSARKKICLVMPLHFFSSKSTISRFGEYFRDVQYSLVGFLLAVLRIYMVPPCPVICKSGGHVSPVPYGVSAIGHSPS